MTAGPGFLIPPQCQCSRSKQQEASQYRPKQEQVIIWSPRLVLPHDRDRYLHYHQALWLEGANGFRTVPSPCAGITWSWRSVSRSSPQFPTIVPTTNVPWSVSSTVMRTEGGFSITPHVLSSVLLRVSSTSLENNHESTQWNWMPPKLEKDKWNYIT